MNAGRLQCRIDLSRSPIEALTHIGAAVAAVPDFVYTFDLDGRFTYANQALHHLLQLEPGAIVGLSFRELDYPKPLAEVLQAQIQEVIASKAMVRAETPYESAFGVGYYEYIFVPVLSEDGNVAAVAGTTRDITERRRVEEALLESQSEAQRLVQELRAEREKLKSLFEQAPAFIATLMGPDFVFEFANEDYFQLVGRREIIGKSLREALPEVEEQGFIDLLKQVYETGVPFVGRAIEVFVARAEGERTQCYLDFVYQPIRDASGTITGILAHGVDLTAQVLARKEVERLYAEMEDRVRERTIQLEQANHEMEGFTYSVSHDLRAPLRAIVSTSRILIEDHASELDMAARRLLERQESAANKLATLIDELLKLSRLSRQELQKMPVNLSDVARTIALELAAKEGGHAHEFAIQPDMVATADPTSIRLLLMNLMDNACKFSSASTVVEVGASVQEMKSVFWVRDRGVGFDMQYAHKVFLPFERLVHEDKFPGTGIGLANVKRIAERHGGRVWVESAVGEGSTFFFTIE